MSAFNFLKKLFEGWFNHLECDILIAILYSPVSEYQEKQRSFWPVTTRDFR